MYTQFFGLKQEPFSIAPDPRYLFMSERHREALAHLLYGLGGGGGFVLLSGEIGAGKTTVCRCFLEQVPKRCNVAYIFNPKLTATELLKSVCDEFGIRVAPQGAGAPTVKDYLDPLNDFLLKTHAVGQNNILIIDEAQSLSADVLEQLRLLTNLETNERKLLQIVLIGQPELRAMLARPELEQLAQRVIARFHLDALSESETVQYIRHRLAVAGRSGANPFDREAMQRIHKLSRGVPRRINLLCDRALLGAYAGGRIRVKRDIVDKAAKEVFGKVEAAPRYRLSRYEGAALIGLGLVVGAALFAMLSRSGNGGPRPQGSAAVTAAAEGAASTAATASSAAASAAAAAASTPASTAAVAAPEAATGFKAVQRSEDDAWRELASTWKLAVGDGDPCQAAQRQQVHCFKSNGSSLALIRRLDRPAILMLHHDEQQAVHAVLTGLTNEHATLLTAGITQTVPLPSLGKMWRGEFATLWRAPPGYIQPIGDGSSGPAADWLARRLATLAGDAAAADAPLKARVHAFQSSQGIKPDGLAGPITLMQLNRATGVEEPRLQTDR